MTRPAPTSPPEARIPTALHKPLTTGVVAVTLLTALTACGSDADTGSATGSGGSSTTSSDSGSGSGSDAT
ncbi:hypothetical protein [Streptomyces hilarionis]|uniref:hypothetical protein n=1 Tax=Streptomyces hilarionis TaxID=2839954 RepID=UPI00211A52D8|nr:hypothetical protein [Streptomyces hilarionis]MCQ9134922.1 hypothetical protein [Streptomyces hilarionis]